MKKGIHPNYRPVVFQDAAANFAFLSQSCVQTSDTIQWTDGNQYPLYKLEISSASHPFFTGKMKLLDTTGRVQKFTTSTRRAATARRRTRPRRPTRPSKHGSRSTKSERRRPCLRVTTPLLRPAGISAGLRPASSFRISHFVFRTLPTMFPTLEPQLARYLELEQQLYDPAVAATRAGPGAIGKERGALAKTIEPYLEYKRLCAAIADAEAMAADPDLKDMADEELAHLRPKRDVLHAQIEERLLVDPSEDFSRLIVEIRAGTGGDEARAVRRQPVRDVHPVRPREGVEGRGDRGQRGRGRRGFKEVSFGVSGDDVYQFLRYESGGHRVQRVPGHPRRRAGSTHSAATVAVLPEPERRRSS
jgi:ribosomal protein L31